MKLNKQISKSIVAAVIGLMVATAASANVLGRVVKPGDEYQGHSYNELASEWTNWLTAEPIATNPAFDPDGSLCGQNQAGDVWFLASTFGGVVDRTCVVPDGKAIFLSLGGVFLSFAPEFPSAGDSCLQMATDVERVRCDVNNDVPVAPNVSFEVTLDGVPVTDLLSYRAQSEPGGFTLRVPNPSFITDLGFAPGDRFPAVADGYFLFLKPLRPGKHALNFRMIQPGQPDAGVNYILIIQ